jgi:hypothetical protein
VNDSANTGLKLFARVLVIPKRSQREPRGPSGMVRDGAGVPVSAVMFGGIRESRYNMTNASECHNM